MIYIACGKQKKNHKSSVLNFNDALKAKKLGKSLNFQPKQVVVNQVFTRIDMSRQNFGATDSALADFSHVDFGYSNLYQTHLQGAQFVFTNLKKAYLMGADVRGANFTHADLESTNFTGAIYSSTTKGISSSLITKFKMILQADEVQAVQ